MASPTIDPSHAPRIGPTPIRTENTKIRKFQPSALARLAPGGSNSAAEVADPQYSHRTGSYPVLLLAVIFGATRHISRFTSAAFSAH